MVRRAARQAGLPVWLLQALVGQESGGRQSAVSPKGASGMAQLMPGTARGLERRYHINTRTPYGNLLGGAYYLKEQLDHFGSIPLALAAYNAGPNAVKKYGGIPPFAETQGYVRNIMGKKPSGGAAGATNPEPTGSFGGDGAISAPVAPSYTKEDAAREGLSALASGHYDPQAGLAALRKAAEATAAAVASSPGMRNGGSLALPILTTAKPGSWRKWVTLAKGADRPGVATRPLVLSFVGHLGQQARRRLVVGTGTSHNEYVVGTRRVSAHWSGRAVDIPASGAALTRLGRLALMQAGMSRAEAMKVTGGLFNIGGWQIIFNTHEGGNHFNHLHVGSRA